MNKKYNYTIFSPYFGSLPNNFNLWLNSCSYNKEFKFIVFTDDKTKFDIPENFDMCLSELTGLDIPEGGDVIIDEEDDTNRPGRFIKNGTKFHSSSGSNVVRRRKKILIRVRTLLLNQLIRITRIHKAKESKIITAGIQERPTTIIMLHHSRTTHLSRSHRHHHHLLLWKALSTTPSINQCGNSYALYAA